MALHKRSFGRIQACRSINVADEFDLSLLFRHGNALRPPAVIDSCVTNVGTDCVSRSDSIVRASEDQTTGTFAAAVAVCSRIEGEADSVWTHGTAHCQLERQKIGRV